MPKKERKVTCPRCHRSITRGELAEHMREHKGRIPSYMRATHVSQSQRSTMPTYVCDCGLKFETREDARKHLKGCNKIKGFSQVCSICSTDSYILLPYDDLQLCPTCAVGFFETKRIYGSSVINHMGIEYEDVFRKKVEAFLPQLKVEKLSDLGIDVVLMTFSQGFDPFRHSISPRGELVFIFAKTDQIREREKKVFESVINHEVFHAYVTHKLKLAISNRLKGPFSFLEGSAAMLAEDIQLDKIAVRDKVWPLVNDEIIRDFVYYEKTTPPTTDSWNALPDSAKLLAMISVTWAYAVNLWFAQVLSEPGARKQLNENLRLIHPHYTKHGYAYLKDLILRLFNEKVAETEKESENMVQRLLSVFNKYSDAHGLMLY